MALAQLQIDRRLLLLHGADLFFTAVTNEEQPTGAADSRKVGRRRGGYQWTFYV